MRSASDMVDVDEALTSTYKNEGNISVFNKIRNSLTLIHDTGGVVYLFGNGGSSAQSAHFAGELTGRFQDYDRPAIMAIDLSNQSASLTAICNDFEYAHFPSRVLQRLQSRDLLILLSTSGASKNVLKAIAVAEKSLVDWYMICGTAGYNSSYAGRQDRILSVSSSRTSIIQEITLMLIHDLCAAVDKHFQESLK